ncbi:DUF4158 domain-containing protein [Streptomyces sp. SA15]|uniref:DUF4158 domain-containing protein n=1 Tax=Streptomyces sp. SA15 TaxID=934019 RepID=UPI00359C55B8
MFCAPSRDEVEWAFGATNCDKHLLALLLMLILKSYQRMGCFPKLQGVPEMVVDFVRRAVELTEGTLPLYRAVKTPRTTGAWSGSGCMWLRPRRGPPDRRGVDPEGGRDGPPV